MKAVALAVSLAAAVSTGLAAAPASAQGYYYGPANQGYGVGYQAPRPQEGGYSRHAFNGQADAPGDYRCDSFWDADRTDCGARWRDQRRSNTGYGHGHGRGHGYARAGYGYSSASVYPGAYGRPDLVYPGGGHSSGHGRDPGRIAWCRGAYRSYDPASGYYRAYSGRLIFCG